MIGQLKQGAVALATDDGKQATHLILREEGNRGWCSRVLAMLHESDSIALMATILGLPYTTAIRPSLRGGFLYGLPCLCPVSTCALSLQCAESTPHPALPCRTRRPAVCRHDPQRGGHGPQRADPSSPWAPPRSVD